MDRELRRALRSSDPEALIRLWRSQGYSHEFSSFGTAEDEKEGAEVWAFRARRSIPGLVMSDVWDDEGNRHHPRDAAEAVGQVAGFITDRNVFVLPPLVADILREPWAAEEGFYTGVPRLLSIDGAEFGEDGELVEVTFKAALTPVQLPVHRVADPEPPFDDFDWGTGFYYGDEEDGVHVGAVREERGGRHNGTWWGWATIDSNSGGFTDTVFAEAGYPDEPSALRAARDVALEWVSHNDVEIDLDELDRGFPF